ncbi:hypothetical protein MKW98_012304 [Papaver atlanticum]|uniref:Neprosin PEP catalytic domain-containing protein n=1 Tax=Papaver atlanticum TaxID=357466 RepID=A0AAD4T1S2_9MAGN|nr:hypothetical protein MKW98_012304 [Papaver atlanticum]
MGISLCVFVNFLLVVVILNVFSMNTVNYVVEGAQSISKEEDMELGRQLKILNKPPIKIILSAWGDTYDCINIYKQPAFDHPLLRNHKIQMKPISELEQDRAQTSIFRARVERFPEGSVPIRMTEKQDFIRARLMSSTVSRSNDPSEYFAGMGYQNKDEKFYGATANMSVWQPNVTLDQYSLAEISIRSGWNDQSTRIHAGWMVNPMLYNNDSSVRYFIYWTAGCFNMLCPGFFQVHPEYTPDMPISDPSIYGKILNIIGYWPAEVFPLFGSVGAKRIYWGGYSRESEDGHAPQMGSGHFPLEYGYGKHGSYFTSMQYYNASGFLLDPNEKLMIKVLECKKNYDVEYFGFVEEVGHIFQYGGPGGKC